MLVTKLQLGNVGLEAPASDGIREALALYRGVTKPELSNQENAAKGCAPK